jgi:hypothetical protein
MFVSLLFQLSLYSLQMRKQMQNHFDACPIDLQITLQPADTPQLNYLFSALAPFSTRFLPRR